MSIWSSIRSRFGFSHQDVPDTRETPSTEEIATRRTRQLNRLMSWLPNPDKILKDTGKHIQHLRELTYDDQVFSALQFLFAALREHEWELVHEGQEDEVALVTEWMEQWDWDRLDNELLQGRLFGYQPLEVMWAEEAGRWRTTEVKAKPAEWFAFSPENEIKLRGRLHSTTDLEDVPWGKFILARNKPSYKNPYGQSVLSRCFWPATFKKADIRYLMTFLEKYGMPWAVGKHPRSANDEEIQGLLDMLADMIQDAVAAVPDDSSVEIKEGDKKGSSETYTDVARFFDQKIDKVLLSSELVTSSGEHGTHALGSAQIEGVAGAVVTDLARMKENTMQQLLHRIWHFNGFEGPVPGFNLYLEREAGKDHAERDATLAKAGVQFKEPYFERRYNFDEDEFEVTEPSQPGPSQGGGGPAQLAGGGSALHFQQAGQEEVEGLVEQVMAQDETNQALMEELLQEPMEMVRGGENPQQIMQALAARFPELGAEALEERLRSLFFAAEMWGRLSEDEDDTLNE